MKTGFHTIIVAFLCMLMLLQPSASSDGGNLRSATNQCGQFDFSVDTGKGEKCGYSKHGGAACKSDCCDMQKDYCTDGRICLTGSCTANCLEDRGCAECSDYNYEVKVGRGQKCGDHKVEGSARMIAVINRGRIVTGGRPVSGEAAAGSA